MNRMKFLSIFLTNYRDRLLNAIDNVQDEIVFFFFI